MKKALTGVTISWFLVMLAGVAGLDAAVAAELNLENDSYDFGYLITEVRPSITGRGRMFVKNNNTDYPNNKIVLYVYRTAEEIDPYLVKNPSVVNREDIYTAAKVPAYAGANVAIEVLRGLEMGEGKRMEFYFSVAVEVDNKVLWQGTRKVSYESCAKVAGYAGGVVCKLREQKNGVLYYDAYLNGVLMRESVDEEGGNKEDAGGGDEGGSGGVVEDGGAGEDKREEDHSGEGGIKEEGEEKSDASAEDRIPKDDVNVAENDNLEGTARLRGEENVVKNNGSDNVGLVAIANGGGAIEAGGAQKEEGGEVEGVFAVRKDLDWTWLLMLLSSILAGVLAWWLWWLFWKRKKKKSGVER